MRWLWWIVGLGAFLAMLYSCALPGNLAVGRDGSGDGLAGTYTVNGVDPLGEEYSGTLIIIDGADAITSDLGTSDLGTSDLGTSDLGTSDLGSADSGSGSGSRVTLEWIVTGAVHEGVGIVEGDQLTVEWRTVSSGAGDGEGTATYRIQSDGSLVGSRLIDGVDTPATEEIFPEA
jgi:hypothetical protein